jgi:SAM-dependent methyltransferase
MHAMTQLLRRLTKTCDPTPIDSCAVGLHDMHANGWFHQESGQLAPGFRMTADDTCLDVGCGDGGMSQFAAATGAEVIATDIDPARIDLVRAKLGSSKARRFGAFVSDSTPLPIAEATATRIICTEVLEHVDDPRAVLAELVRVGKPGAIYLLTVPDETAERVQMGIAPASYWQRPNHLRIFSRESFSELVADAGLAVEQRLTIGFFWSLWWMLFWAADQQFGEPETPLLASWSQTWHALVRTRKGDHIRHALDEFMPKSQVIIARKAG